MKVRKMGITLEEGVISMTMRKSVTCALIFILLLIGAGLLDRNVRSSAYSPEFMQTEPDYGINAFHAKETSQPVGPFHPREYVRIIRRSADEPAPNTNIPISK